MAQLGDVRVEESLRVKIGEAKNLPPVSYSGTGPKTCCAIKIDSEEIFRTATVEKSLDPFFNAEFQGEIPKKFRYLSFYLYDVGSKNKVLGKVSLKKEELYKYHQIEHWFPLTVQDGDAEVQGKVQLEIRFEECVPSSTDSLTSLQRMAVRVLECSDLTVINGACNPYAVVTLLSGKGKSKEVHRTAVKKKTICPLFDETFFFSYDKNQSQDKSLYKVDDFFLGEISVSLFHDDSKVSREVLGNMFKGSFLGEVRIPLSDIDLSNTHRAWYCLQAKESTKTKTQSLGSIRLCINYSADYVFPSKYYDGLRDLILMSPSKQPISSSAAFILGEIVDNRQSAAQPLVKLLLHHGKLVPLIHALADWEISNTKDPNTLFRGNSLLTKMVDELMKYLGLPYLHDTLKGVIDKIVCDNKPCEIDPNRLKDGEDLASRLANLHDCVQEVLQAILDSSLVCPSIMRDVFAKLKAQAIVNYPNHPSVRYHAVTSFVFLRFFTAAILGPKLFDLISDIPDVSAQRNLTLISKAISGLISLVTSPQGTNISVKEEYMVPLFDMFRGDAIQDKIKMFLEIISSSSSFLLKSIEAPIILKEGYMIKRAQGRKKFGRKNFKKRFFILTNQSLSYSTCKGGKVLFEMLITDILAVEKVQEESFKMKYMFQIVQQERTLYIQANNCVEEKEWLDILTKICKSNRNQRKCYHPAAYVHTVNNSHWLCCKSKDQNYVGCTPVTGSLPLTDIQADIDSDREVEKIHSLFLDKMDKLEILQDLCGTQAVYAGDLQEMKNQASGLNIEDPSSCFATIAEIQKCIITLEQEHIQYMRSVQRHTVIGSIDTPIGDESGADLVRNMNRSSERLSRHGSRSSNASNLSRRSGRVCRSRGGSFRERDRSRSGTEPEGVKKSMSGDVSSTGQNLGVDFKQTVKKAASYDTFAMDRRMSQGANDLDTEEEEGVSSGNSLLSNDDLDLRNRTSRISRGFAPTASSYSALPTTPSHSLDTNSEILSAEALDSSIDGHFGFESKDESFTTDLIDASGISNEQDFNSSFTEPVPVLESSHNDVRPGYLQTPPCNKSHACGQPLVRNSEESMECIGDSINTNNVSQNQPIGLPMGVLETSLDETPSLSLSACNSETSHNQEMYSRQETELDVGSSSNKTTDEFPSGEESHSYGRVHSVVTGMDYTDTEEIALVPSCQSLDTSSKNLSHDIQCSHSCVTSVSDRSSLNGHATHLPLLRSSLETKRSNDFTNEQCSQEDDVTSDLSNDMISSDEMTTNSRPKDFTDLNDISNKITSCHEPSIPVAIDFDRSVNDNLDSRNIDILTSDVSTRSEGQDITAIDEVEIML